jgi:hypothetical protein
MAALHDIRRTLRAIWDKVVVEATAHLLVLIIVAAVSGVGGYLFGFSRAETIAQLEVQAAPLRYAAVLRDLVERADQATRNDGPATAPNLRVFARGIVQVRDDLRGSLTFLSGGLNTELDRISDLVNQYEKTPTPAVASDIAVNIRVLNETWPARQAKIEYGVRKMLAEMGFHAAYQGKTARF